MTEPWIFESGNIDFSKDVENILLRNESIDRYLSTNHRDKYLFLVGPKGIGKTFLLNYKSYLLRLQHNDEIKFSPPNELSENLMIFFAQFSKDEITKFQSSDIWENIWKYALLSVSCKTYGIEIEEFLELPENDFSKVSNVLSFLLSDRKNLSKTLNSGMPKLIAKAGTIKSGIAIFLDGIDIAVDCFVDEKFYDYETYQDKPLKVWTNIHVGIAKSIYDISKLNSHIKIHTTLRSEAFKLIPGGQGMNLDGFAIHLNYSGNELKEIFNNNIKLTNERKLVNPDGHDCIEKFLGYNLMPHPFVKNQTENPLDFILRHTLGRPREIVYLGNKLYFEKISKMDYKNTNEQDRIEDIRFFINEKSEDIISNYLKEIIPTFSEEYLIKFLKKVQSNVFHYKILNKEEIDFLGICYNVGLVGIITNKTSKNGEIVKVQHFKNAGDYVYHNNNDFPKSEFYITHPILDCYFTKIFNLDFYNSKNIIGQNYNFEVPKFLYDYAISYSSHDKSFVDSITSGLKENKLKVFYDRDFEKELIGVDLLDYLCNVYKKSAKNVIIFLSESYLSTRWTSWEFKAIKQRLLNDQNSNFIKLIRIDNVQIPDIMETTAYIDASRKSHEEIIQLLKNND